MLVLYGRAHCPLCEEMAGALERLGLAVEHIDVDAEPALRERYGSRVPVLADRQGVEICEGRVDAAALRVRLGLE